MKHRRKSLTKLARQSISTARFIGQTSENEINRGRKERRIVALFEPLQELKENWAGISRVIAIRRVRECKGKKTDKTHVYISNLTSNEPEFYLRIIRSHWAIENQLHWVKDVILKEDITPFATYDRIKKNTLLRNFSFTCVKRNNCKSVKYTLEKLANNPKKILEFIRT